MNRPPFDVYDEQPAADPRWQPLRVLQVALKLRAGMVLPPTRRRCAVCTERLAPGEAGVCAGCLPEVLRLIERL